MPDYDHKNIPTLDDIIEDDEFNAAGPDSMGLDSRGQDSLDLGSMGLDSPDQDLMDLDSTDLEPTEIISVDLNTGSNTDASSAEVEERAEDSNLDLFLGDTSEQPLDLAETSSDKNDHNTNNSATNDSSTNANPTNTNPVFDIAASETLKISLDPAELESIVESVVNNLLPDLEQQLRTLLRQTLEEKLNEEVSTLLNSETTQHSNTSTR